MSVPDTVTHHLAADDLEGRLLATAVWLLDQVHEPDTDLKEVANLLKVVLDQYRNLRAQAQAHQTSEPVVIRISGLADPPNA